MSDWYLGEDAELTPDATNLDYDGRIAQIGDQRWRVRTARVTPTKPGAFVAVWRRDVDGGTEPFDSADVAGLLVFVEGGVFRFTAEHLADMGITSSDRHPGKRGFRVYQPDLVGLNPRAARTQRAQASAFVVRPAG
ncbi:metallopeptidase [Gordonia spumicola]|uniref:Metallopeptidase n=1 Tax=Gordonia spumicola TaxID=589161 RepID=A0A7I9V2D0_9ACTN|nr:MepB family protein [Gordonia spumicola]GED99555.1 metallopeptidase [Gordonia spumicola]GED99954.1 metallopeptidase [Gordonia spumicola]GEE04096.1 metallopeptidase [Gordonia spumicola]GEE04130.1 metallopeptidase [Gordonia spumicola]